jgi:hypothetical protein
MGPEIIHLGMRLQAISFNHSARILHYLLLHTFRAPTLFVHALVPFVFPLQVGTMIQEYPSKFFPTASGISGRVPRRTTTFGMASTSVSAETSSDTGISVSFAPTTQMVKVTGNDFGIDEKMSIAYYTTLAGTTNVNYWRQSLPPSA